MTLAVTLWLGASNMDMDIQSLQAELAMKEECCASEEYMQYVGCTYGVSGAFGGLGNA